MYRWTWSTLAALSVLAVAGCSSSTISAPSETPPPPNAASALLSVSELNAATPDLSRTGGWTPTSPADETPKPCGFDLGTGATDDSYYSWGHQQDRIQIRRLGFADEAAATRVATEVAANTKTCQGWLEAGASVSATQLTPTATTGKSETVEQHLSRIGADGRTETGWAVTRVARVVISVSVSVPAVTTDTGVDGLLHQVNPLVVSSASTR